MEVDARPSTTPRLLHRDRADGPRPWWLDRPETGAAWIYRQGDEELFRLELTEIFGNSWLFAGLAADLPSPGDYLTWNLADRSYLIVRDREGALRAYLNRCPHRGSALSLTERGTFPEGRLTCPYHFWVFGLDGRPLSCRGEAVDPERTRLLEVPLDVFAGNLVFIRPEPGLPTPPPSEKYAWLPPRLRDFGLAGARSFAPPTSDPVEATWLTVLENNQESYHAVNHREYLELFRNGIQGDHHYRFASPDGRPRSAVVAEYLALARDFAALFPRLPADALDGWSFYYLYPNTGLTVTPHEFQIDQILPVTASTSEIRSYRFGAPSRDPRVARLRELGERIDEGVKREDLALFPLIQRGLNSARESERFRLTAHEEGVARLYDYLLRFAPVLDAPERPSGDLRALNRAIRAELHARGRFRPENYRARFPSASGERDA